MQRRLCAAILCLEAIVLGLTTLVFLPLISVSTGTALAQDLRGRHPVKLVPVERDKQARLYVHQAKFEAGLVRFPQQATWLRDLLDELLVFPVGKADDQVDSISQALAYRKSGYDSSLSWVE